MAQKRIDFITFDEFEKLYRAEKDKQMKLCILLGFGSGLRISEIVGLKRKDGSCIPMLTKEMIDFQKHQIKLDDAKGKKWRITITPPALKEDMINLLPINIPRRTIQYKFEQLSKHVLTKKMSFHTLRHGFGNYMVNVLKLPLPMVQSYLGHSRLDTTGIYTKANPEHAIDTAWRAMMGDKQ